MAGPRLAWSKISLSGAFGFLLFPTEINALVSALYLNQFILKRNIPQLAARVRRRRFTYVWFPGQKYINHK